MGMCKELDCGSGWNDCRVDMRIGVQRRRRRRRRPEQGYEVAFFLRQLNFSF
jgi:hypothetical protein